VGFFCCALPCSRTPEFDWVDGASEDCDPPLPLHAASKAAAANALKAYAADLVILIRNAPFFFHESALIRLDHGNTGNAGAELMLLAGRVHLPPRPDA
jgi:hypothetical protein